ncbi:uncharacterized protein LOC114944491 [Nylanderia fulva]|uniref:uncharacterized protein LOC114944491 n=1 Tax=Nylanderia fulva TaxID=613905 RepID=UPI0010FBA766|nr:uncharacterized protein LOC114944491 [Nylanderia fulva]
MTSFGRGRGWSSLNKEQTLRRPGDTAYTNTVKDIIDKVATYDTRECISPQLIQEIIDLLIGTINKDNLKDTCDSLWKQAILYDSLTIKIAVIFSDYKVAMIEDSNKEIVRSRFLRFLQDNYMSREKSKTDDKKTFANIVLLHAEVYYRMRLSDGSRLNILAEPLIQYLEDLLQDNGIENIYFIMIQILKSGKDFYAVCPSRLENLILIIRQMLVKENSYISQYRAMLLLIIELVNNNYEIKDELKQFYISNIKTISFEYPFSQKEVRVETKIETDTKCREYNKQRIKEITEIVENNVSEGSYSKNPNIPRAIRGSGALDTLRKGDNINTKLNSLKISPRQKNNKGWDHDDRFHKDYE